MSLILSGTDGLSDVDGTVSTPAIRGTDANTGIFFPAADTIAFSEGGAEAMRITSGGEVLIGSTSNPFNSLLYVTGTPTSNQPIFSAYSQGGANVSGIGLFNDAASVGIWSQSGNLTFRTNGSLASGSETMRITSSGNVGIGTSSPAAKLGVLGDMVVDTQLGVAAVPVGASGIKISAGLNSGDGGNPRSCILCNTSQSPSSNPFILFTNLSNNTAGSITHTGTTTVAYNTSSDYRLKENIAPMTGALAKVAALKPCTYTWKEDGTDGQGFIAHELQEVISDCVSGEKDAVNADGSIKPQGVDTSFLVATLTAAIQEQQALIENLTTRLNALEGN